MDNVLSILSFECWTKRCPTYDLFDKVLACAFSVHVRGFYGFINIEFLIRVQVENILDKIIYLLNERQRFILGTIISESGSTPRSAGSKMIIQKNQEIFGTIGGGFLEADILASAKSVFQTGEPVICRFDMNHTKLAEGKMVCGGGVQVLLEYVEPTSETIRLYQIIKDHRENRRDSYLIKGIFGQNNEESSLAICVLDGEDKLSGQFPLSLDQVIHLKNQLSLPGIASAFPVEGGTVFAEWHELPKKLVLFGAGHVSREVAKFAHSVGFQVSIIDDREEFANPKRFPDSGDIRVIEDYQAIPSDLQLDSHTYVAIMTRGHLLDKQVLSQVLKTQAAYIGMIGSRRKRNIIYETLIEEGFNQIELERVHCPIGMEIGAETPDEIALSIVAELVKTRARKKT